MVGKCKWLRFIYNLKPWRLSPLSSTKRWNHRANLGRPTLSPLFQSPKCSHKLASLTAFKFCIKQGLSGYNLQRVKIPWNTQVHEFSNVKTHPEWRPSLDAQLQALETTDLISAPIVVPLQHSYKSYSSPLSLAAFHSRFFVEKIKKARRNLLLLHI